MPDKHSNATTARPYFAELNCLSNFSFLQGASHPEELVQAAVSAGYQGLAITDECSLAGAAKAWLESLKHPDFKLIIGSEFRYQGELFIVLAHNPEAYASLCRLITGCRRQAEKGDYLFTPDMLLNTEEAGLLLYCPVLLDDVCLTEKSSHEQLSQYVHERYQQSVTRLHSLESHYRGKLYLLDLISRSEGNQLLHTMVLELEKRFGLPVVASNRVMMHSPKRKMLLDCLHAIRLGCTIQQLPLRSLNAENHLRPLSQVHSLYQPEHISNTIQILERCTFRLGDIGYQYPRETTPRDKTPSDYLQEITYQGALKRYKASCIQALPKKVLQLIEKELGLIEELSYSSYFLTIYDIVSFARSRNILCQGRGSAANSVVCYCLFITEVDPMRVDLLFERFISRRRNEPPDIDVDFENARREEVIQYIYQKYGRHRCALAATVIRYRPKSAIRDVAKALDLNLSRLDSVIANYGWRYRSRNWIEEITEQCKEDDSVIFTRFRQLLSEIIGFPRHLSQHIGGFIITDAPLIETVPVENAAMPDRTVIQWEKTDLEAMGLMKVDILALGMLSAIQKTLTYISQEHGKAFSLSDIPKGDDPDVYRMLQKADSVGLFQVESRAQMNMLPRLKPETYYDLVVQVAIVRPGPIHGDMVHPYLLRKHGKEPADIPLPELKPILDRTYGVPIFQEQVIAMAMQAADFSADEAEELRRSMASWKKEGHMHRLRQKMSNNLLSKGLDLSYVERICRQIEGFGEYGFPESHAASFALIAYTSAWLKYHYPAQFFCGLLNSQPMGFYPAWQLIQDAQRHKVQILPVSVNHSTWDHQTKGLSIQLGLRLIKGLPEAEVQQIISARPAHGYTDMGDLCSLSGIRKNTLEKLAQANALAGFKGNRFQQTWDAAGIGYHCGLFQGEKMESQFQVRAPTRIEDIQSGYATTGILLDDHPMAYLRDQGLLEDCLSAEQIQESAHETEVFTAGLVVSRQRPKTSAGVTFITLEDETGSINLVIWLQTALKQLETLVKAKVLKVYGKVDRDSSGDVVHLIAYRLFDISSALSGANYKSRDFH